MPGLLPRMAFTFFFTPTVSVTRFGNGNSTVNTPPVEYLEACIPHRPAFAAQRSNGHQRSRLHWELLCTSSHCYLRNTLVSHLRRCHLSRVCIGFVSFRSRAVLGATLHVKPSLPAQHPCVPCFAFASVLSISCLHWSRIIRSTN